MVTLFKIIFGIYYAIAAITIYYALSLSFRRLLIGHTFDFDSEVKIRMERRSRWFNVRLYVSQWADVTARGFFWPAMGPPRNHDRELRFFLITDAIILAVISLAYLYPAATPTFNTFLNFSAWALALKLVYFVVYPVGLPQQLRRTPHNAYLVFVGVFVAAFVAVVVTLTGLETVSGHTAWAEALNLTIATGRDLASLNVSELVAAGVPGLFNFKVLCSVLLFLVFFRTIFRWSDFKRSDEDLKTIANGDLLKGDFESARNWLEKVSKPDAEVLLLKIPTVLGLDQVELAASYEDVLKKMKGLEKLPFTLESDTIAASLVKFPVSKKIIFDYVAFLLKAERADEEIALLIVTLVSFRRIAEQDVVEFFSKIDGSVPPMCSALVLFFKDEVAEGMRALQRLNVAGRPTAELFRRYLLLSGELMLSRGGAPLHVIYKWYENNFADMLNCAMKANDEESIELTFRLLMPILKTLERELSETHVRPMYKVLETLIDRTSERREYFEKMLKEARERGTLRFELKGVDRDDQFE